MTVSVNEAALYVGETATATATAQYSNGSTANVTPTWVSSAPGVASVDSAGLVRAVAPGAAAISAHLAAVSGAATVTVLSGPRTRFGAGQYLVGTDIASGRYFTKPTRGCYWERQRGLGGGLSDVIANEFIGFDAAQWIVDILPSDLAFQTDAECETWTMMPVAGFQTVVPPGVWLVGSQVAPGTYRATVSAGCYWERLRDFTGNLSAIIANEFVSSAGSQLVAIASGDVGFSTDEECGPWTRVEGGLGTDPLDSGGQTAGVVEENRRLQRRQDGLPILPWR